MEWQLTPCSSTLAAILGMQLAIRDGAGGWERRGLEGWRQLGCSLASSDFPLAGRESDGVVGADWTMPSSLVLRRLNRGGQSRSAPPALHSRQLRPCPPHLPAGSLAKVPSSSPRVRCRTSAPSTGTFVPQRPRQRATATNTTATTGHLRLTKGDVPAWKTPLCAPASLWQSLNGIHSSIMPATLHVIFLVPIPF